MAYTTIDDPTAYFQTKTYTGNGSARAITFDGNSDLQPDWVWIKKRNGTTSHTVTDSVRGVNKQIFTNEAEAEESYTSVLTAFGSNGFSLSTAGLCNTDTNTYVSWNWKAGTSFTNDASSTGIGSIDSSGSVSTDAGFSIIRWSGTGSNATIAHGLGSAPKMMIIKRLTGGAEQWIVYHQAISPAKHLFLNLTDAENADTNNFQNTATTSSVFSVGTYNQMNASGTNNMIAYCFAEKQGYSKFGAYPGNGNADGPFIFLGFRPAFLMIKGYAGTDNWIMYDNKRSGYNSENEYLDANNSDVESDGTGKIDFLSNGFKIKSTFSSNNYSTGEYIYMAFAENPFVTSTGVPATAR
jgi:hypothetical protein